MIIACPACSTRYVVPDSAIGIEGRTVRCARCRHSWFQDGPELAMAAPASDAAAAQSGFAPAAAEAPRPPRPAPPPPVTETPAPAYGYDDGGAGDPSPFDNAPPFRPRRNWTKIWTIAAVLFAVVVSALVAALMWFGLPDWVPGPARTFGAAQPDLELVFPAERQERRALGGGASYFGISGSIVNKGKETRRVPPVLIVLRDAKDQVVYRWEIDSPKKSLAPGESVTVNEARTDVPTLAKSAEIGWKP